MLEEESTLKEYQPVWSFRASKADHMDDFSQEELTNASRAINSLLSKCEKAQDKFSPGTSQHTLLKNRINALRIATALIATAIAESVGKKEE
jgi:hypothetical protein